MRRLFFHLLLIPIATFASPASVVSQEYKIYGVNPPDQRKIADICAELKTDHLHDLELLHRLHSEFKDLLTNAQARAQLRAEIQQVTERIIAASNPAWNKEVIPFQISWNLPRELFFDETEYKAVARRWAEYIDLVGFGSVKNSRIKNSDFLKLASNPNQFTSLSVLESYYVDQANQQIQRYFFMPWYIEDEGGLNLSFEKKVTALEYCQFLAKTKFLIKIDYNYEALGLTFSTNQNFLLEIKMESL